MKFPENIKDDIKLLKYYKKEINNNPFLKNITKDEIMKLDEKYNLNYQSKQLIDIWAMMLGDAIVFLKKLDNREKYSDEMKLGVKKLYNYINDFQNNELIFYGSVNDYRDHTVHVFRTYLLGDYFIKNSFGYNNIKIGIEEIEDKIKKKEIKLSEEKKTSKLFQITKEEKEAMWCIISLTHDLGYPLQSINKINEKVRGLMKNYGPNPLRELEYTYFNQIEKTSDFALKFMSSDIAPDHGKFLIHIQPKYYEKFISAASDLNHGVLSSILLMKDLVYFKESDYLFDNEKGFKNKDVKQFFIRREIIRSIASHSCDDIYHLLIPNYSFLLNIFDEMQEWGRPRLIDITKRRGSLSELKIDKFNEYEIDYSVIFKFENPKKILPKERNNASGEIENYFRAKCEKWLNVLRSAVGGDIRQLTLKFKTIDETDPSNIKIYKLEHPNPSEYIVEPLHFKDEILNPIYKDEKNDTTLT